MITFASCFAMRPNLEVHGSYTEALVESSPAYWECSPPLASRQVMPSWAMPPSWHYPTQTYLSGQFIPRWEQQSDHIYYTLFFIGINSQITFNTLFSSLGAIVRSHLLHSSLQVHSVAAGQLWSAKTIFLSHTGIFFLTFLHPNLTVHAGSHYWAQPLEMLLVTSALIRGD
jgi:hypothetical protein